MGILFAVIGSIFASLNNLLLRRSICAGGGSKGYQAVQTSLSFLMMVLLNPVRMHDFQLHRPALYLGIVGGVVLGCFYWVFGKAMEKGPAGLSVAILNASTMMPAVMLAIFFGTTYGHQFTIFHGIGFLLMLMGVFWAAGTAQSFAERRLWMIFALLMFGCHSLFLIFLQWWAMVLNPTLPLHSLLPFHIDSPHIYWFMPAIFLVASCVQWGMFMSGQRRPLSKQEIFYGSLGGISNGLCSFFLILAPQMASSLEKGLVFPIFSVVVIAICNAWSQFFYAEKVNWKACSLCIFGIFVGAMAFF